jgi:hypothetical protein
MDLVAYIARARIRREVISVNATLTAKETVKVKKDVMSTNFHHMV